MVDGTAGYMVAHEILMSSQGPLVLDFGFRGLGPGLDNSYMYCVLNTDLDCSRGTNELDVQKTTIWINAYKISRLKVLINDINFQLPSSGLSFNPCFTVVKFLNLREDPKNFVFG